MSKILASALPEKPVSSANGRKLGNVRNLTVNFQTGKLENLIIKTERPDHDLQRIERTEEGHLRVPVAAITGVDDQVVVSLSDSE